jgi:hypothetical protein
MKSIKQLVFGLCTAGILSTAATAFAYVDTDYFVIERLEASTDASEGYRVYPQSYSLPTNQGCSNHSFAEMHETSTAAERELINRTLLSAFLAGKKVKLRLDGCGVAGRPRFRIVTLNVTQ